MRFSELIFVFLFVFLGLIGMIARIIASKRKEKGAGAAPQKRPVQEKAVETSPLTEFQGDENALRSVSKGERLYEEKTEDLADVEESTVFQEMGVLDNADLKDDKELAERPSPGTILPTMRTDEGGRLRDSTVRQNSQEISLGGLVYVQNSRGISQEGRVYISAWEKINQLSLMKRAIVLSEILGKPKGLE